MSTLVTPARKLIFIEGAQFLGAVSEELVQRQGAVSNFISLYQYQEKTFNAHGFYGRLPTYPRNAVDGLTSIEFNAEIIDAYFYIDTPGTGGITEVDVKYSPPGSAVWTSIFTTTPKFDSTAAVLSRVDSSGNNPATTGVTAPVLNVAQTSRDAGDSFRLDIITAMTGDPVTVGMCLFYRPR